MEVAMIGPTANPVMIVLVTTIFFVGLGYISYFFGKKDFHMHRSTLKPFLEGIISFGGEALKSLSFFVPTPLLGCTDPGPWSSIGGTNAFPLPRIPAPRSHVGKGTSDLQRTSLRLIRRVRIHS